MNVSSLPKRHSSWDRMKQGRSAHLTGFVPRFCIDKDKPDTAGQTETPRFSTFACRKKGLFPDSQVPTGSEDPARFSPQNASNPEMQLPVGVDCA